METSTKEYVIGEKLDGMMMYHVLDVPYERKPIYLLFKRLFDFVLSLIGLVVLCIPMLIIAIIIRRDSPGPAIYRQERLGKNGKPFMLYKFRSMRIDAEKAGAKWADKNDPRVTRVGKVIRNRRLDELPQLVNILKGDMSIVGPRPERPIFYEKFSSYIDGFDKRLKVIPGLTGWAQINGGYDLLPEEKVVYDMEYIERRSLLLDMKITVRTVEILFSHNGAR